MSSDESDPGNYATPEGVRLPVPSPPSDQMSKTNSSRKRDSEGSENPKPKQRRLTSVKVTRKKKGKKGEWCKCAELNKKVETEKRARQGFEYDNKKAKEKMLEIQALHQIIVRLLDQTKFFYDSISRVINKNYERATASSPVQDVVDVEYFSVG